LQSPSRPSSLTAVALLPLLALAPLALAACNDEYGTQRTHSSIAVDPLALDFAQLEAGQSASLSLSVSNTGSTTLLVSRSYVRNDARSAFSAEALPAQIAAGASVKVALTYRAPDAEGPDGAQFVIESDADNAPEYVVSLTGRAAERCLLGQRWCDGACVDTANDPARCGDCTTVCAAPDKCLQGKCGCEAKTCAASACGDDDDGCGKTLGCGECASPQVCVEKRCLAPTCTDHLKDGDETDVDCGGKCSACPLGKGCATLADCEAGLACVEGVCSHCRNIDDCPTEQVCRDGLCGACLTREECGGGRACLGGRCLSCPDEASFNECGLCGGAPVSSVGAPCASASGCAASYACNAQLVGVECPVIAKNECGVCGGVAVSGLGAPCTSTTGCASQTVCNAAGDGAVCAPMAKNECGVCGGAPVSGLGTFCIDGEGCDSKYACNAAGDALACAPVGRNACKVCGGPAVGNVGKACVAPSGCDSTIVCNAAGDAAVCDPIAKNECGKCGGTPVTGLGINCPDSFNCQSEYVCNAQQVGVVCAVVGRNECGLCGGIPVIAIGDPCRTADGCDSKLACAVDQISTSCTPVAKDECGVCGGTTAGIGTPCSSPISGCASTWACGGNGRVCTEIAKDECGMCGGSGTGIGSACTDPVSNCASTWACVSGTKTCTPVAKNACNVCGGATVTHLPGTTCTSASGCGGIYECVGADTVCNAPTSCSWANHLVISQICGEGPTVNDDYVEIYNPTSSPISVTDHRIFYRNTANVTSWTNQIQLTGTVPAHGWFLVAHSLGMYPGDVKSNNTNFGADGGQMMLWKGTSTPPALPTKTDSGYVDLVGYGTAAYREGAAGASSNAPAPGTGGASVRKANPASTPTSMATGGADALSGNGTDTDDNGTDFVQLTELKPRTTASTPRP
jgi:hypothetical protein